MKPEETTPKNYALGGKEDSSARRQGSGKKESRLPRPPFLGT